LRALLLIGSLLIIGCHDDDGHHATTDRPHVCEEIVEACHARDPGSGPIHDCHTNAEATWTAEQCSSNAPRCYSVCAATDTAATDAPAEGG
jgi:hypothetical protein